jgi:hypothetical protein
MSNICICSQTWGTSEKHKQKNILFAEKHEKWFKNISKRQKGVAENKARVSSFHEGILDQCGGGIANNTIKHDIKRVHAP